MPVLLIVPSAYSEVATARRMKRQFYPRSRSRPRNNTPRSCPQSRRSSVSSENLSSTPLDLEALNDGLISILECPVCFETMLPPIFQCKEGHNVCHTCKERIKTCPLCRQTLVGRNVAVEHISNKLLRHCANQDAGCKELVSLDSKEHHEQICSFRKYECLAGEEGNGGMKHCSSETQMDFNISVQKCELPSTEEKKSGVFNLPICSTNCAYNMEENEKPVSKNCLKFYLLNPEDCKSCQVEKPNITLKENSKSTSWIKSVSSKIRRKSANCVWSGVRFDILEHMKSSHPELANIGRDIFDLYKAKHEISLISALDEVFWLHLKRDPRRKLLFACVSYIGPVKNAAKYLYKFTVYSRKTGNKVSFTYQTPSDTVNVDDLFNRGEAAVMNYKAVNLYIDEQKKLPWKLKIKIVDNKS